MFHILQVLAAMGRELETYVAGLRAGRIGT
jgi:hypothetical protein